MASTITVDTSSIVLEKIKKAATTRIGSALSDSIEFRKIEDIAYGMILELQASVLATKLADDTYTAHFYYKVPSSWFQHFKMSKAPRWFTKRYPVSYDRKTATQKVKFTRYETYPLANIAVPRDRRTIELLGYNRPILDTVDELIFSED